MTPPRIRRKPTRPLLGRRSTPAESAEVVVLLARSLATELEARVDLLVGSDAIVAAHTLGTLHAAVGLLESVLETYRGHATAPSTTRTT